MMNKNGNDSLSNTTKWVFGVMLSPLLVLASTAESSANIDEEVNQRIAAIHEVVERLEFDADRIANPPAYRQAIDAFTGSVCAALTASADIDFTLVPINESLMGEGEAESPSPVDVIGVSVFGEAKKDYGATVGLSVISDHSSGITHRLCINLVPWAVYAYYRARAEIPGEPDFPEIVPDEVFLDSQTNEGTPAELRQATRVDGEWDELSPDALAFLQAIGSIVLEGLSSDTSGSDGLPWISSRIDDVVDVLGLSVNSVASATSGLAEAIPISAATFSDGFSIGELFSAFHSFPERIASNVPFAPAMDWLPTNPFGFDSLSELDYCAALDDHGPISEIPYLNEMLDTSCEVLGLIDDGASEVLSASMTFVDTVVPAQEAPLNDATQVLGAMGDFVSAQGQILHQFYHQVIGYIGDTAYAATVRIRNFANGVLDFLAL